MNGVLCSLTVFSPIRILLGQAALEEKFELGRTVHVGTHAGAVAEGKVLNRIIRRTPAGWEIEADIRHAELLAQQVGGRGMLRKAPIIKGGGWVVLKPGLGCAEDHCPPKLKQWPSEARLQVPQLEFEVLQGAPT